MQNVAIIGGNSLLGQHLFSRLQAHRPQNLSVWTFKESFLNRLEANQNNPTQGVRYFVGLDELQHAIAGCDTVFNVHEFQDFSNVPDKQLLQQHNVNLVDKLLQCCLDEGAKNLVHVSSIYLQCSRWWPNVASRELDPAQFVHDNPFPAYFNSKYVAERLINNCDGLKSITVRVGPLYGEGDRCSVICDAVKMCEKLGLLPIIGDLDGAVQMTYAGNAADALFKCAEKLTIRPNTAHETVNISDSTPVRALFDGVARDCFEAGGERCLASLQIPFWLFFPIYFMFSMLGYLLSFVPFIKNPLGDLPSASYIYFLFRQWTFVSDYRLRLLIDYTPRVDETEALHRSLLYYGKQLHPGDVKFFSWRTMSEV